MAEYRTSAHAKYDIKYHLVWITKYRYKVLRSHMEINKILFDDSVNSR